MGKNSMDHDEWVKSFIKDCKKNQHWLLKMITNKKKKEKGCKKAAEHAWKQFQKNAPEKKGNSNFRAKLKW
jgi:hypothetical protein